MDGGYVVMELGFSCSSVMVGWKADARFPFWEIQVLYTSQDPWIVRRACQACQASTLFTHTDYGTLLQATTNAMRVSSDGKRSSWARRIVQRGGNVGPLRVSVATSLPRSFLRSCLRVSVSRKLQHHDEDHHDVTARSAYGAGEYTEGCSAANGG